MFHKSQRFRSDRNSLTKLKTALSLEILLPVEDLKAALIHCFLNPQ